MTIKKEYKMKTVTTIVFGDPFIGTTLNGIYDDVQKAKEANKQKHAFPFFSTEQITYEETQVDLSEGSKLYTVAHGNPFEGMYLIGLWNDPSVPCEDTHITALENWTIVEIQRTVN